MTKKVFIHIGIYSFLFLISIPLILPFFHSGYFPTHDGLWAVVRLGEMFRELRDHQFPPRYSSVLNFGYGYPLFNFAYPFPYYIGILIHFVKIPFIVSIKLLFAISVPLSAFAMYIFASSFWKNKLAGVVGAVFYIYMPYRLVDLYVRGSIGESVAYIFFPLILLAIYNITFAKSRKIWIVFGSILLALIITSHNIFALLFSPIFLGVGTVCTLLRKEALRPLLMSFFLGLGLAAFFFVPALVEKQYILLSKMSIADRSISFVKPMQLIFPSWNYGVPGGADGFTYQLGWPHALVFLLVCMIFASSFLKKENDKKDQAFSAFFIVVAFSMILMLFSFSNFLWSHIPLLSIIDYPWILLGPIGFLIAFLSGYVVAKKNKIITIVVVFFSICAILLVLPYARPQKYIYPTDAYFLTNDATTTSSSEYTPIWVKQLPLQKPMEKVTVATGAITILENSSRRIAFTITIPKKEIVTINTIYYPGWKLYVDGKPVIVSYNNPHGVMQIPISMGAHIVLGTFTETPLRLSADIVSIVSILILCTILISIKLEERKK